MHYMTPEGSYAINPDNRVREYRTMVEGLHNAGLRVVQDILDGIPDIHFARLTSTDVVRHKLVGKIVDAYERYDAKASQPARQAQHAQRRGTRR